MLTNTHFIISGLLDMLKFSFFFHYTKLWRYKKTAHAIQSITPLEKYMTS